MNKPAPRPPNLLQILGSVLAAAFGVQSQHNRERDFKHGRPWHYILVGIILTTLFVFSMLWLVRLIAGAAG